MATRTGKVILARDIGLDKQYKNILNYTESQMVTLVTSKAVATATNCSFLRQGANVIDMAVSYGNALKCNYMAFQNPDYSNKWFFAFIDEVEYISNGTTRIHFTIDECSTWYDYWSAQPCLVVREHVNDDTIGLNIVDEGLEHGEYVWGTHYNFNYLDNICYLVQATQHYDPNNRGQVATNLGGLWANGTFFYCKDVTDIMYVVSQYDQAGKGDAIQNVYIVPQWLISNKPTNPITANDYWWHGQNARVSQGFNVPKPTTINGYTPRNNKLFCQPYNMLVLDNNNGSSNTLYYEDFTDPNNATFAMYGVPVVGGSIICYPTEYKGNSQNLHEGIVAGKFPPCGWTNDVYTNWLTQNAVNIQMNRVGQGINIIGGGIMGAAGILTGNPMLAGQGGSMIGSGITSAMSEYAQKYQYSIMPPSAGGNINSGDILTAMTQNKFSFNKMSIKAVNAQRLDEWFDRFGYKVNRLKIPNQTGRPHWNFVQIAAGEDIGRSTNQQISVPAKSMDVINAVYRAGTTIWHNHAEIGNFALDNTLS